MGVSSGCLGCLPGCRLIRWLDGERRHLTIGLGGFGLGFLPLHKLCRIDLMVLGYKCPWGIELEKPFAKDIKDFSGVLGDSRKI